MPKYSVYCISQRVWSKKIGIWLCFVILCKSTIFSQVKCLGVIPHKHGVIFPRRALFHFGAKKIHVLYLETEGEFANLASGDAPIRNYTVNCHGYTMGYLSIRWHLSFLVNICIDHPTPKTPEGMSFFIGSRSICQKDIDKDLMYRKLDLQFFEVCSARYWDKRYLHNTMTAWTWIFFLIMLIDLLRASMRGRWNVADGMGFFRTRSPFL
jgi:hypothetical protein